MIYDGLTPYGRFGLGLGVALYAVLPLAWLVLGAIVIIAFYRFSRSLRGLPAICHGDRAGASRVSNDEFGSSGVARS